MKIPNAFAIPVIALTALGVVACGNTGDVDLAQQRISECSQLFEEAEREVAPAYEAAGWTLTEDEWLAFSVAGKACQADLSAIELDRAKWIESNQP